LHGANYLKAFIVLEKELAIQRSGALKQSHKQQASHELVAMLKTHLSNGELSRFLRNWRDAHQRHNGTNGLQRTNESEALYQHLKTFSRQAQHLHQAENSELQLFVHEVMTATLDASLLDTRGRVSRSVEARIDPDLVSILVFTVGTKQQRQRWDSELYPKIEKASLAREQQVSSLIARSTVPALAPIS
jgi:hypothetical protein